MQFDAESCMLRMRDALQNPGNKIEGGFCMDNIRAVAEEIGRLDNMELALVKEAIAKNQEELVTAGNENHYIYWAKKVPGVGNARAKGKRDGSGIVYVSIISDKATAATQELLEAVAAYIATQRPVGACPVISAAEGISVTVEVTVALRPGYSADDIRAVAKQKLEDWLINISFSKKTTDLSYSKVGSILFNVPGVDDIPAYTINGGRDSIKGDFDNYFSLAGVIIHASA